VVETPVGATMSTRASVGSINDPVDVV